MISLPNNCRVGKFSVSPANWNTPDADPNLNWRIIYWFYDDNLNEKKQVSIKGMNHFKTLKEKQEIVKTTLKGEMVFLKDGFNPIKDPIEKEDNKNEIQPETLFIPALRRTWEKLHCVHSTKLDIKSTIKYVEQAAKNLNYDILQIKEIRRKHIKRILERCEERKTFTDNTFNAYRKNLGILFRELVEMEAMETNITRDIRKRTIIRKIKRVLTPQECKKVSDWVKIYDYRFWLLIHIFFHSGCRTTEIFRVQRKHVDLENQTVLITVLKGNRPFEVLKPIKNIALDFWKEAIKKEEKDEETEEEDFIFAKGLVPGKISIHPRQATRRWKRHIKGDKKKGKLGIICDWYALKYLNTDQITKEKGLKTAGLLNSHTNTSTTKLYAIGYDSREVEEIKNMKNKFA